jgi:hypothetical protein
MIEHEQELAERHAGRPQRGQCNGTDQQGCGQDCKDAWDAHMNSFSPLRSVYNPATNDA